MLLWHVVLHNRLHCCYTPMCCSLIRLTCTHAPRVWTRECILQTAKTDFTARAHTHAHSPISISIHKIISTASSTLTFKATCCWSKQNGISCQKSFNKKKKKNFSTQPYNVRKTFAAEKSHMNPPCVCVYLRALLAKLTERQTKEQYNTGRHSNTLADCGIYSLHICLKITP